MGQNQPKESDVIGNPEKVQNSRQQAQGDAKWDDIPEINRVGAKFQDRSKVNPASGTGSMGNPGKPV